MKLFRAEFCLQSGAEQIGLPRGPGMECCTLALEEDQRLKQGLAGWCPLILPKMLLYLTSRAEEGDGRD